MTRPSAAVQPPGEHLLSIFFPKGHRNGSSELEAAEIAARFSKFLDREKIAANGCITALKT